MTSGIYQLNFNDKAYYVGQSQDLESRWKQHADKFLKGKSAKKMQDAYDAHGMPTATILLECHKDYLDIMENYYIAQQKTYPNCLNTTTPPLESNIDYDWLMLNTHMLKISSIDIIREFIDVVQQKDALDIEHESVKNQLKNKHMASMARAELQDGKDINAELVKHNISKIAHIESELARIRGRGLLDRVFNHQ